MSELPVGKALALAAGVAAPWAGMVVDLVPRIAASGLAMDSPELGSLPLSGIPGRQP